MITIKGLDCSTCVLDIDGMLEDTSGIIEARTNFAKQTTQVTFHPQKISPKTIIALIQQSGYEASLS